MYLNYLWFSSCIQDWSSQKKLWVVSMFSRITFILVWFQYFSVAFLVFTASLSEEIFVKPSIPRFWTILPNYLLKISTNMLSSETILLFSTKVTRSSFKILSVDEGFTIFQKTLLSVMYFTLRLMQNSFLVFLNTLTQKFLCLLYADLVVSVFFPFSIYVTAWDDS